MKPVQGIMGIATARGNRDGLYFPVNFDVAAAIAAAKGRWRWFGAGHLYFPVIPEITSPSRQASRSAARRPVFSCYFEERQGRGNHRARLQIVADSIARAGGTTRRRYCKSLQIVADAHAAAVGRSCETQFPLLREIAAVA